ncbi:MAG: class I SAM-dependent methyltransferase [Myxococcota bacterium]
MGAEKEERPGLSGVPETMLWTLHNRAHEVLNPAGVLQDDRCVEIYRAIDYDYERSFGPPTPSHGVRSKVFDDLVRGFMARHPDDPVIVNLGEGLETQRFRFEDDPALWFSVDLPDAMEVRERFIQPDARHQHVAKSALDTSWMDAIPEKRPVFVTAQGLLMYFAERDVRDLVMSLAQRWPGVELAFDHIPPWLSNKTMSKEGMRTTKYYRAPPMPWGLKVSEVVPRLRAWVGEVDDLGPVSFGYPRGAMSLLFKILGRVPVIRNHQYGIAHVRLNPPEAPSP